MPNWASTEYIFKAKDHEQAKDLYEKIDSLAKMEEPLVENGFGKLWMGCLVNLLGGDWNKVYCRGEIIDYNLNGDIVSISCETAWEKCLSLDISLNGNTLDQKSTIRLRNVGIAFMPQTMPKESISKTDTASTLMMGLNTLRPSRKR